MHFTFRIQPLRWALFQGPQPVREVAPDAALLFQQHEFALLDLFARGFLTIDQVLDRLARYCPRPQST